MRIAKAFGCIATVLTGLALAAWVALAVLTAGGGLESLSIIGARENGLDSGRLGPRRGLDTERSDSATDEVGEDSNAEPGTSPESNAEGERDQDSGGDGDDSITEPAASEDSPIRLDDTASDGASEGSARAEMQSEAPASGDGGSDGPAGEDAQSGARAGKDGESGARAGKVDEAARADEGSESGSARAETGQSPAVAGASGPPDDVVPAVDWPELPELEGREPLTTTARFRVFADPADDELLATVAIKWAPDLDATLDEVSGRMNRGLKADTASIVFTRAYDARCPARGLAAPGDDPLVLVFIDEDTDDVQIKAVVAHEMAHLLTFDTGFVGDGVLTEGIANWAAGPHALAWQEVPDWSTAARRSIRERTYTSIADDYGLNPRPGEDCIARRDRVYNARTAFVEWLIDEIGLETVLAMPVREEVRIRGTDAEGEVEEEVLRLPDYSAAAGASLTQLERRWLAELMAEDGTSDGAEGADDVNGTDGADATVGADGGDDADEADGAAVADEVDGSDGGR